ncbi:MAG: hypothetical protein ACLU0O_10155 [Collinsella sp.]
MTLLYFLTLFPLVPALGMLFARGDRARDAVGLIGSGIIMAVTVVVAVMFLAWVRRALRLPPAPRMCSRSSAPSSTSSCAP